MFLRKYSSRALVTPNFCNLMNLVRSQINVEEDQTCKMFESNNNLTSETFN